MTALLIAGQAERVVRADFKSEAAHVRCVLVRSARHFGLVVFLWLSDTASTEEVHMKQIHWTNRQMSMLCATAAVGDSALPG